MSLLIPATRHPETGHQEEADVKVLSSEGLDDEKHPTSSLTGPASLFELDTRSTELNLWQVQSFMLWLRASISNAHSYFPFVSFPVACFNLL